jgi:uncharacterized protein (TIGR02001 family)
MTQRFHSCQADEPVIKPMNTKLLLTFAGALAVGSSLLSAQTAPAAPAPAAPSLGFTFTPSFVSQYMFRGVRLGGAAFQPTLEAAYGDYTLGIWASTPVKDKVPGVSDPEIDFYGSYTAKINDATTFVTGFTWYTYPDANKSAGFYKSTFEPSIALNYTVGGLKLTPKLYYDFILDGLTAEVTAFYAVPMKDLGSELDFTATWGTYKWDEAAENTTPAIKNWGDYWSVGVAMPFQVSTTSKITVGFAYVKGDANYLKQGRLPRTENTAAVGRGVVSLAYSISF